ncbi:hypothetical protein CBS147325_7402 [Penicillium roqueforti]|nr:hypothetical protein CBS147325_7402 [Penicillium roqueforti]KAI3170089.1 hypothetical protein DTO046C5_3882 [Penicillium roqueforti]
MKKSLLLGDFARKQQLQASRPKYWAIVSVILICSSFALKHWSVEIPTWHQHRTLKYTGEQISWEPCGFIKGNFVECGNVFVPMDQFNQSNSGNKIFTIPLIRMRGTNATQNLILNPGGPGASGFEFLNQNAEQLRAIVGEGLHLVSFDPRGVNSSTPLASCYPDVKSRKDLAHVRSRNVEIDSPEVYAWTQNFVKACHDTMGEHAKCLNTPQTAADMNDILDALGQRDMVYWGFSYGSLLGQTYAGLFPERSKRVIIDGVVNQFKWYDGTFEIESQVDTDKVLDGFFEECTRAGTKKCPLSSLATSVELRDTVLSYMNRLREQPIGVYVNNTAHGVLGYEELWYDGVLPALYYPSTWGTLANNLYSLIQGNATNAFLAYGREDSWDMGHEASEFIRLNDGLSGPKNWPQDRQPLLDYILTSFNQSMFGARHSKIFFMRQQWTMPRTHSYVPRKGVTTAHPLLILSTTWDPVTPLTSARSAKEAFQDSQIVEVKAYGHCSIAVDSSCAANIIRDFLYEGKLPHAYTECEVDSPYFKESD